MLTYEGCTQWCASHPPAPSHPQHKNNQQPVSPPARIGGRYTSSSMAYSALSSAFTSSPRARCDLARLISRPSTAQPAERWPSVADDWSPRRQVTIDMDDPESIRTALLELQEAGAVAGGITMSVDAQIGVLEPLLKPEVASPEVVEIVFGGKPPPLSSPPPAHGANPPLLKPSMERGGSALIGLSRGSSRNFMGSGSGSTLRQSQGSQGSQRSASNLSHGGLGGIASAASSTRESRESAASEAPLRASRASFAERAEDVAESFGETVKSILPKGEADG